MGEFFNCEGCGKRVRVEETVKVQGPDRILWLCRHCYYERGGE